MATALSIRHFFSFSRKPRVRPVAIFGAAVSVALIAGGVWPWLLSADRAVASPVQQQASPVPMIGVYRGTGEDGRPVYQLPSIAVVGHRSPEWIQMEGDRAARARMNLARWIVDRSRAATAQSTTSADRDRSIQ